MEVILRETVDKLGRAGDLIEVKDGYARNFLLPHRLAYPATEANKRRVEAEARARGAKLAAARDDAQAMVGRLAGVALRFAAKAGEGDKLFGSITAQDIAAQLAAQGIMIDKRDLDLPEPIKALGEHRVPIRLHPDVRGEVLVQVDRE